MNDEGKMRQSSPLPSAPARGLLRRILYPRPVAWVVAALFPTRAGWRALAAPFFWAALSGAALATAFPPLEWGAVAWIGLAPFLAQLPGRTVKEGTWLGLVFGMVFFALDLLWLLPLTHYNPFAPVGILLMSAILAASPMLFGALATLLPRRIGWWHLAAIPALWTAVEAVRGWTELAFPWMLLGHTQVNALALIQICDLTGVAGITFLVVLVNGLLAETYRSLRESAKRVAQPPSAANPPIIGPPDSKGSTAEGGCATRYGRRLEPPLLARWALVIVLVGVTLLYGWWRLGQRPTQEGVGRMLRVALIQPGLDQVRKMEASAPTGYGTPASERAERLQQEMNATLNDLVLKARRECESAGAALPDIYVLPETAFTNPFFCLMRTQQDLVRDLARLSGAPLFFGADRYVPPPGSAPNEDRFYDGQDYNSAYLATPEDGVLLARPYDKMHLVPFGEYSSYFGFIPGFTHFILGIEDITPGRKPRVFETGAGGRATRFGAVICFESCFASLFRLYDQQGVDWMAVITNDAWYGLTSGARRHQTLSVFRAVEMRRPVGRVANTGISCVIDAWGRTLERLPLAEGVGQELVADVPLRPASEAARHTFYMRAGEWFTALCFAIAGAALVVAGRAGRQGRDGEHFESAKVERRRIMECGSLLPRITSTPTGRGWTLSTVCEGLALSRPHRSAQIRGSRLPHSMIPSCGQGVALSRCARRDAS
jgi:apolipoprotein N-acyltransferase